MGQPMWDERYRGEEYVYGTSPNDFFTQSDRGPAPGTDSVPGQ